MDVEKLRSWLGTGSINIFGWPFSGKDTQSNMLADLLGAEIIGSGQILRSQGSENLKKQMDSGHWAPTEEFLALILPYFSRHKFKGKPLILNEVGRWIGEEQYIIKAAAEADHPLKAVVVIQTNTDETWRRWAAAEQIGDRGERYDDDKEKLSSRLEDFESKTEPVLEVYRKMGILVEVDGIINKEAVFEEIIKKLEELANA